MSARKKAAKANRDVRLASTRQEAFLAAYVKTLGNISDSAKRAKCARTCHYEWLKDERYADRFADAHRQVCEMVVSEIDRRAIHGVKRPVYQGGKLVGHVQEYSDVLLIFRAKALMPEYRERIETKLSGRVEVGAIKVIEDADWYGNGSRLSAPADVSPTAADPVTGAVQGGSVRPPVGKNGSSNGSAH